MNRMEQGFNQKDSEKKYTKLFENALDAIFVADAESGILIDCNPAACELVGRKKTELMGKHQSILHPRGSKGKDTNTFKQHLKEKEGQILETQVITKNGEIKDVAIKANLFEFEGRKVAQGIFRDITEQIKIEKELREAYNIINKSPVVIFLWKNAEGWPIEFVTENVKALFGYTAEEFKSAKIHYANVVHPDDLRSVGEEVEGYSKDKDTKEFQQTYRIICKDEIVKTIDNRTTIRRDGNGKVTHYQGIVLDKTEQVKAEGDIKNANKELEKFNKLAVGRELKMIELKKKIKELEGRLKDK